MQIYSHGMMNVRAFGKTPKGPKIFDASKSKYAILPAEINDQDAPPYLRNPRKVHELTTKNFETANPEDIKAREQRERVRLAA